MTLRIGIVCPYSLTVPGGVQMQVLGLGRELRRLGHEARVLGPCDGPPPASFVTPLGNSLPTAANGSIAPLAPDPSAALRTMRALRDENFDVVHVHEPLAPGPPMTATVIHAAPTIGTFHAAGRSTSYRVMSALLSSIAGRLDHRVAVSKDAVKLVGGYLGGDYEVLFNAVETEQIRATAPHPNDRPTVFFCGRHEERKGLAVLLEALQRLERNVGCQVASDGPETARLQREYAHDDRIEWLGQVSDEEKIERLRGASVFCAPSLHGESFGIVLLEAMAADTPVVASALDGYRNVATDGVDALLVPPGDIEALAHALEKVIGDQHVADQLRAGGRHRADGFAMSALATEYLRISYQLLDRHRANRV